jgi:hypothetical protein
MLEEPPLPLFFFMFLLLLPAHVLANLLLVNAHGADAVPPRPEVAPPVLAPELRVLLEELLRQLPFEEAHQRTDRVLGRDLHHQVDVIRLDVEFEHFDKFFLPEQLPDLLPGVLPEFSAEDSVAILWTKHRMIFTLVDRVREFLEPLAPDGPPWLFRTFQGGPS